MANKFNYFTRVTVTDTTFPANPQANFLIKHQTAFSLLNMSSTITVEYSFDGSTLHGDMVPGTPCAGLVFDGRTLGAIWFRASASATVRIESW